MIRSIIKLTIFSLFLCGQLSAQTTPRDTPPTIQGSVIYDLPRSAVDALIDGKVEVGISVNEGGVPTYAVLMSGPMWPCGETPRKALNELSSTLVEMAMKLRFSPGTREGMAVAANIVITLDLKNPKLALKPEDIDPLTGKPKVNKVVGGVINGKARNLERPSYPSEARKNRVGGVVSVLALIDEKGDVIRAGAVDGPVSLQFAAREAACKSKYTPTLLAGKPVKVSGIITYNFVP